MGKISDAHLVYKNMTQLCRGTQCPTSLPPYTSDCLVVWCITHGHDILDVSHVDMDLSPCVSAVLHPDNQG